MLVVTVWHTSHGLESVEDQVSMDVGRVVYASKPDLVARGVTLDLLQMASELARSAKPLNTKICPGRKVSPWTAFLSMIEGAIKSNRRRHRGTLNESTNVGVKIDGSRVGGPELCV